MHTISTRFWRTVPDHGMHFNESRFLFLGTCGFDSLSNGLRIVTIRHFQYLPAVCTEAISDVLGKDPICFAVQTDGIGIIEGDELTQL